MAEEEEEEGVDLGLDQDMMTEVLGYRTAARFRDYTTLVFEYGGESFACVPLERSDSGLLVILPSEAIPESQLRAAARTGFTGLLGPYCFGECRLRGPSGRAIGSAQRVLVADLRVAELRTDPEDFGGPQLGPTLENAIDDLWSFGAAPTGEARWLHPGGATGLINRWLTQAAESARLTDYVTGDEGREALAATRSSGDPSARPKARAKVMPAGRGSGAPLAPDGPALPLAGPLAAAPAVGGALSAGQLDTLLRAAGRGQGRPVGRFGAAPKGRAGGPAPRDEEVEDDREGIDDDYEDDDAQRATLGGARIEGDLLAALGVDAQASAGALGPVIASIMLQNQGLLQHLTKQTRDPLQSALEGAPAGGESGEGQRGTGLRGVNARDAWIRMIKEHGEVVRSGVRERLADAMEVTPDTLQPAALRGFFERKVPLGQHRGLTFFSYIVAKLWEYFEQGKTSEAHTLTALAAIFCEQTAVDGGRYQTGWLLTGLPQPSFNLTQANTQRNQEEPYALLASPTWISANLAYLKDMDYFEQRQRSLAQARQGGGQGGSSGSGGAVDPKRRPRRTPKSKAQPEAKP